MCKKVLIAYATRFGATTDTADRIKKIIEGKDYEVELLDLKKVKSKNWPSLDAFEGIIIASGIKMGKWTKQAKSCLEKHLEYLRHNPNKFSIFVCCGTAAEKEKVEKAEQEYLSDVFNKYDLPSIHSRAFSGIFDFSKTSKFGFLEKSIMKSVAQKDMDPDLGWDFDGVNDFRDFERIEKFAIEFVERISA
jgi:menaquinone-dependent protoporphyrinogen oxidase